MHIPRKTILLLCNKKVILKTSVCLSSLSYSSDINHKGKHINKTQINKLFGIQIDYDLPTFANTVYYHPYKLGTLKNK